MSRFCMAMMMAGAFAATQSVARADGYAYVNLVASGCVVDSRYAANALIDSQYGTVSFSGSSTGVILLTCPIPRFAPDNGACTPEWELDLYGNSSTSAGFDIKGYLDVKDRGTGSTTWLGLATKTGSYGFAPGYFNTDWNFTDKFYWVDVELDRPNTTSNPVFHGVAITLNHSCL